MEANLSRAVHAAKIRPDINLNPGRVIIETITHAPLSRAAFAVDPTITYFNHAATGVLPIVTRDALHAIIDRQATSGVLAIQEAEMNMPAYRAAIGAFIGASGDEIAMLRNTSDGATVLAQGLDLQPGDEILTNRNEFGANAYPWLALRKRGINVRFIDAPRERMTPDSLAREITSRTKVVAVSWVTFDDGYRHDLAALSEITHRAGALFFVDVIQALGAFPFDVNTLGIDACFSGGAKWLMALPGIGFLYVRNTILERIAVNLPSWRSVQNMWNLRDFDQSWAPDATRYEGGTPNFAGVISLATSIGVLHEAGPANIAAHVLALTDRLVDGLTRKACSISSVRSANERSGIVSFTKPGTDTLLLGKQLAAAGFITTNRPTGIRVSPHGYNTHEEIDAFIDAI